MSVYEGQAFLLETPMQGRRPRKHLTIIAFVRNQEVLTVPICSAREYSYDPTVEVKSHEHTWIKKDSFVEYSKAEICSLKDFTALIDKSNTKPREPVNKQLLLRIRNGLQSAKFQAGLSVTNKKP